MPAHYTQQELIQRRIKEEQKKNSPKQMNLFDEPINEISIELKERIIESEGHHWKVKECSKYAEYIQID